MDILVVYGSSRILSSPCKIFYDDIPAKSLPPYGNAGSSEIDVGMLQGDTCTLPD